MRSLFERGGLYSLEARWGTSLHLSVETVAYDILVKTNNAMVILEHNVSAVLVL